MAYPQLLSAQRNHSNKKRNAAAPSPDRGRHHNAARRTRPLAAVRRVPGAEAVRAFAPPRVSSWDDLRLGGCDGQTRAL